VGDDAIHLSTYGPTSTPGSTNGDLLHPCHNSEVLVLSIGFPWDGSRGCENRHSREG
jgi:hypothetical protein